MRIHTHTHIHAEYMRMVKAARPPQIMLVLFLGKGGAQVALQVCIYGVKLSFWGSGTLKIVIYVENHPQKRFLLLADYHPLWVGGC